ncbi:hypothetical protein Selin_0487 [Desulfurispirillum indicum S5]|uniref:Cytochrome c-552/4 domain-containing protein n=1 Tax=Desulfurispirillum indicum (strain ATCC BAA-1389 / DSM 22839 / S5) TaxID=653733 RepID=E6W0I6_DESIS|nr:multiheme c-type cytochrome [Desulfurispirillum indicum]ADU65238.1 hypothetical protein Selin_0487 [Desulfurispirillum indicum S5]
MKKLIGCIGLIISVCVFSSSGFAVSLDNQLVVEEQQFAAGAFEGPGTCLGCHHEIHTQWSHSMHAYAWQNRWYQDDYRLAHRETAGATDVLCGACHAPIAARTGQLPPHDGSAFDATARQGISCDFCHTVSDVNRLYNMGHVSSPGNLKYGNRGDGSSPYHGVKYSAVHRSAEFCGSCHNVKHPAGGTAIIDTYDDWKSGPYAEQGITCQHCHMTPGPGQGVNPGKSSPMGMERSNVAFHGFVGGSSFAQRKMGNEAQAQMAEEMLRAAAELELEAKRDGESLSLTVHVDNVGAGHKIPTGVTYIRKMWLEVKVEDEQGNTVYHSGSVDAKNHVDPEAVFYRLLFEDGEGNLTGKSWRAVGIGYDRRIPANGRDSETYAIRLPAEQGVYETTVRLMYRSFSQESLDFHDGADAPRIESVEMARSTLRIPQ